ncbi:MAG: LysR family transcriptional regulator, partial [Acidimicrobiia bacterium]|nr:LysR family transcriptional regulator [Acidimicrobiia bacterium]
MELRRLECFVAVARELHFRRAAESIPMAQSALSNQIKMLEAEVGVPLLNRTTRRVELTPAGEVFLEHATAVLSGVKEASRAATRAHEGEIGHIRVGFGGSATYEFVPRVARTFRAAFPQVRLELHSEMVTRPQTEALLKDQIDVGFLRPPVAAPGLTVEVLRHERLVLAMPERHPDAGRSKVELANMADTDFIAYPGTLGASVYSVMV